MSDQQQQTFEETKARLEEILAEVRSKETSLERSIELLEEGVTLANRCNELIDQTDWRSDAEAAEATGTDAAEAADVEGRDGSEAEAGQADPGTAAHEEADVIGAEDGPPVSAVADPDGTAGGVEGTTGSEDADEAPRIDDDARG